MINTAFWMVAWALAELGGLGMSAVLAEDSTEFQKSVQTKALGKALGAEFIAGVPAGGDPLSPEVRSVANLNVLGKKLSALHARVSNSANPEDPGRIEFYSFGKRVFNETAYFKMQGPTKFSAGLAPAEIRVPILAYPVGPVLLEISGGARFNADIEGQVIPTILTPIQTSRLNILLNAHATGAAFAEGDARLIALRAGLGGQVDLIDGSADVNMAFSFDGEKPIGSVSAMVEFLKGRFYAFVDVFNIFRFKWSHVWVRNLTQWNGLCYSTGVKQCPGK